MQRVNERGSVRENRSLRRNTTIVIVLLGFLGFLGLFAISIQLFARYQYVVENGNVWRIDRITQQTCRVTYGRVNCAPPASRSLSTSTSISTSPSLKVSGASHQRKKT